MIGDKRCAILSQDGVIESEDVIIKRNVDGWITGVLIRYVILLM